jgi:Trk K+ transport system NAD-binding subunit
LIFITIRVQGIKNGQQKAALFTDDAGGTRRFRHHRILFFQMVFNPAPSEKLEAGDVIVVIGQKEDLKRMREVL